MNRLLDYVDIENDKDYILIDVRSPKEYKTATIPGAINLPIFTDEEREKIGTIYVRSSTDEAKLLGVTAVSKKLPEIYEKVQKIQREYKKLIFFCERGGMRSSSLVSFLLTIGINAFKLHGGYKGYRNYINKALPEEIEKLRFVVIHGNTGVGKTKILKNLEEKGLDVLDLEGCANHRGSLFGDVGLGKQNSQKQFESLVYHCLKNRKTDIVFTEAESKRIGHIIMPKFLHEALLNGRHINVVANINSRVENIKEDYIKEGNDEEIIKCINRLEKYISKARIEEYTNAILDKNYEKVIEDLMIKYYDPMYENKEYNYEFETNSSNIDFACDEIEKWINTI